MASVDLQLCSISSTCSAITTCIATNLVWLGSLWLDSFKKYNKLDCLVSSLLLRIDYPHSSSCDRREF